LRGETRMNQGEESFAFRRNDIFVSDGRRPFRATVSNDGYRAMAVVPRAIVSSRAPWLRRRPLHKLNPDSPFIDLARHQFMQLFSGELTEHQANLLTENLCNLLVLAGSETAPNRLQDEIPLEILIDFCRKNLSFSKLSPRVVAEHFGISVRTLHSRFAKTGKTFGSWLLGARLEASSHALRDPHQRARSMLDIAHSCGFNDLSHFNKMFRARFGMTPGEWRHDVFKAQ